MILDQINKPNDIKKIRREDYAALAEEIRRFLVENVAETGGHLASNLGAVELTMALHLVLDLPKDKIIWDVGHQSYTHKILTGRKEAFHTLRQYGGICGFPRREESDCDAFDTGHSSTSLSAGCGLVTARDLLGEDYKVVSVIGDGALTGGMAYEALNNTAQLKSGYVIVLNDNNMSISESTGGLSKYLSRIRLNKGYNDLKQDVTNRLQRIPNIGDQLVSTISRTKSGLKQMLIPGMLFENLGITYLGPVDGHNLGDLVDTLKEAVAADRPVLVHVRTKKGKGYAPAERHPSRFHGVDPFDVETGKSRKKKTQPSYADVFSQVLCEMGAENEKVCAITAAMADGTGCKWFSHLYPSRFFDVGIAEEHAVTLAAGMAAGGLRPIVAVYSTFLQRAYDQIVHDVCLPRLPVIFAIDRAGLVGGDGDTHQGLFDLSYLNTIPGLQVIAPKNAWELKEAFRYALSQDGPVAIRYPRGSAWDGLPECQEPFALGKSETVREGKSPVTLVALGIMVKTAMETAALLEKEGIDATVVNARFASPLDEELLSKLAAQPGLAVFLEENEMAGSWCESVARVLWEDHSLCRPLFVAVPDRFVKHGSAEELSKEQGLDAESVARRILAALAEEKK